MTAIYCLNGPNLNLLGQREPDIYGHERLQDIEQRLRVQCKSSGAELVFRQSNSEGILIDWVQEAGHEADGLLLNAAAYTHSSIGLHDALRSVEIPVIEVHLSNPSAREDFRRRNYVSSCATAIVAGLGSRGYEIGLQAILDLCVDQKRDK